MRELSKRETLQKLSRCSWLKIDEGWDSLTAEKPLVIVKLEQLIVESGLKSP